jgi:hypothetical protein
MKTALVLLAIAGALSANTIEPAWQQTPEPVTIDAGRDWTPDPNIQYTEEGASSGDGCVTTRTSGTPDSCAAPGALSGSGFSVIDAHDAPRTPEPATWALAIGGAGLILIANFRRQRPL